jgi:hypothetical protein
VKGSRIAVPFPSTVWIEKREGKPLHVMEVWVWKVVTDVAKASLTVRAMTMTKIMATNTLNNRFLFISSFFLANVTPTLHRFGSGFGPGLS